MVSHHHPEPVAIDTRSSNAGLRAVATFEAIKGIAVLLLMIVLLSVRHRVEDIAWDLLFHLHIDPDRRLAQSFLNAADKLSEMRFLTILIAALSYVSVRFVESWGLWHRRVWAEWFALLSGMMYLPWEALKLAEKPNWVHISVLVINVFIVLYMLLLRIRCMREPGNEADVT